MMCVCYYAGPDLSLRGGDGSISKIDGLTGDDVSPSHDVTFKKRREKMEHRSFISLISPQEATLLHFTLS